MSRPIAGQIEKRTFAGELRASDASKFELSGYAASFNTLSRDLGGFRERLAPGCFKRSLASGADVKALFNHDPNVILGRRENGTLDVSEDSRGLKWCVQLNPKSQQHRDIYASVQRGDINECSFAFLIHGDGQDFDEATDERGQRYIRRTILDCDLIDVSCVTNPAYSDGATSVQARSHVTDYSPTISWAAYDAEMRRKAQTIREEIFRTADAFIIPEYVEGQPWEVTPVFFTPEQKEAHITRQLREKCDEIGRQIFKDAVREELGL